jgi:preprotein translocase subunit SecF
MSRLGSLGNRLYRGEVSYNIVGRRKRWLSIFGVVLLAAAR